MSLTVVLKPSPEKEVIITCPFCKTPMSDYGTESIPENCYKCGNDGPNIRAATFINAQKYLCNNCGFIATFSSTFFNSLTAKESGPENATFQCSRCGATGTTIFTHESLEKGICLNCLSKETKRSPS